MDKHTPGPWQWIGKDLEGPNCKDVISLSVSCTAFCYGGQVCREIGEADARLLAAAPDLLEALSLIASTDPIDAALDPQRAIRVARAAIAKATGHGRQD